MWPDLAAGAGLVALVLAAAVRVLLHDRDESVIIKAWRVWGEAQQARAEALQARLDEALKELRRRDK